MLKTFVSRMDYKYTHKLNCINGFENKGFQWAWLNQVVHPKKSQLTFKFTFSMARTCKKRLVLLSGDGLVLSYIDYTLVVFLICGSRILFITCIEILGPHISSNGRHTVVHTLLVYLDFFLIEWFLYSL